jgi:hypothetical protein
MGKEDIKPSDKPTFRHLYDRHELHLAMLAQRAGVSPHIPYFMLQGQPVSREDARSVLDTLSKQTGITYSLDTVNVMLLPQSQKIGDERCG